MLQTELSLPSHHTNNQNDPLNGNVIKLRKSKIVTGNKEPVTIFMNIM